MARPHLAVLVAAGILAASAPPAAGAAPASYDPARAPIVFLPGVIGSELECASRNLWPGEATTIRNWTASFGALASVNVRRGGRIVTRTTSSPACGRRPYGAGGIAASEPRQISPTWCFPEAIGANPAAGPEYPCSSPSWATNQYGYFGKLLQTVSRGRLVSYGWDWRHSPRAQAGRLDAEIRTLARRGVKVTVVAHSFGNLLFREWLRVLEARRESPGRYVGRFVSIAGPWWGVATGWTHPAWGELQPGARPLTLSLALGIGRVRQAFASGPGTYWLFPLAAFDRHVARARPGEHWLATARAWIPFDRVGGQVRHWLSSCPQPRAFPCQSEALYGAAQSHQPRPGFDRGGIRDWVGIVGSGLGTPLQICQGCRRWPDGRRDGRLVVAFTGQARFNRIRETSGDKNVPVFSAIQGTRPDRPPGDRVPFYFACRVSHMGLVQDRQVTSRVAAYATGLGPLVHDRVLRRLPCRRRRG
jgi:Lecithin:cholesterol acyltransferase